jgi:anti-sigma regulatory factor (Ser/Thr protein kinase)
MTILIDTRLKSGREAAREARRLIANLQERLNGGIEDVTLLTSELVTNSYRYGGLGDHDPILLRISLEGDVLRTEVTDPGRGATQPKARRPSADGGWGLEIVRKTASRWGVNRARNSTTVWFEIDLPRS